MAPAPVVVRRGWRRGVRIAWRGLKWLLGIVVVLIAVALVLLHTDWGRERVRRRLETAMQPLFRGAVHVGRLDGSVFTELIARDVTIDDATGRRAVAIDRIGVRVALGGLLDGEVHIQALEVAGAALTVRRDAGAINLADLVVLDDEPAAWDIRLDAMRISGLAVEFVDEDMPTAHFDGGAVEAGLIKPREGPVQAHVALTGTWRERALPVVLATAISVDGPLVSASQLAAELGGVTLAGHALVWDGSQASGTLEVHAPAAAVAAIVPATPVRADVNATLQLTPGAADATRVVIAAQVGAAQVTGDLVAELTARRVRGTVTTHGLDLAAVRGGALAAHGDVTIALDVRQDPARGGVSHGVVGTVEIDAHGDVDGMHVAASHLRAAYDGATATIAFDARGADDLAIAATATVGVGATELDVQTATITATLPRLDGAIAQQVGVPAVRGVARVDLTVHGKVDLVDLIGGTRLAVRGQVAGTAVRYDALAVASAQVDVDVTDVPAAPRGRAAVALRDVRQAGRRLGNLQVVATGQPDDDIAVTVTSVPPRAPWRIDAGATVRLDVPGRRVAIALGRHVVRTPGGTLRGAGGTIAIGDDRVVVRGLRTALGDATVAVDASYQLGGSGAVDAKVRVAALDLGALDDALDLGRGIRGEVSLDGRVARRGGRVTGALAVHGRGLRLRATTAPVDADVTAALSDVRATLTAEVRGATLGVVAVEVDATPPRDVFDLAAWTQLERAAVRTATVRMAGLDLAAAGQVAGLDLALAGRLDGSIELGGDSDRSALVVRGVTMAALPAPLDAELSLQRVAADRMDIAGSLDLRDLAQARATASLRLPPRPLDVAIWRQLDTRALLGATVDVDRLVIDRALLARLGRAEPVSAVAALHATIAAGVTGATARLELTDVRGPVLRQPIEVHVDATLGATGVEATLTTRAAGRTLLTATGGLVVALPTVLAAPARVRELVLAAPVHGTVTMPVTPVGALLALVGRGDDLQGLAIMTATLSGTVASPVAEVHNELRGVGRPRARIDALITDVRYAARAIHVAVRGTQGDGGTLAIDGDLAFDDLEATRVRLQASSFALGPLARLGPEVLLGVAGKLDADLQLRGMDPATARLAGELRLANAELPVTSLVGTLRGATVLLGVRGDAATLTIDGDVGAGEVALELQAKLRGLIPESGAGKVLVRDVTIINALQPRISARATLALRQADGVAHVDVAVSAGDVNLPAADGQVLHPVGVPTDMVFVHDGVIDPDAEAPTPMLTFGIKPRSPWLVVTTTLAPMQITSAEVRGSVSGKLIATIGTDGAILDGELDAAAGDVALFDRRYRIDRAAVRFDGSLDPELDISLAHDFATLSMTVVVRGRVSRPELQLSAEPGTYTDGQLLSFLLGGEPGGDTGNETQDAASGVASSLLSAKLGGYVNKYLPVDLDVLRYEAGTSTTSSSVVAGKWLTRRLYFGARQRLETRADENSGEFEVEYWLRRRVLLEAVYGDRGIAGLDLLWSNRW